jgi:glycosyltransferase involved in cell wall biosynthesis
VDAFRASGRDDDYVLRNKSLKIIPQPVFTSTASALTCPVGIVSAYAKTMEESEHVFVRGMLPYIYVFYALALLHHRKPVHWIVGNPVALLKSHRRFSRLKTSFALAYAYVDRYASRLGHKMTKGTFLCNGQELSKLYGLRRTHSVISSTITSNDLFVREDTCLHDTVKLLFVGFVRPEKGLEYLMEALPKLQSRRPWCLTIVGSWEKYKDYRDKLVTLVEKLDIGNRVIWKGHVSYGQALWSLMRQHDIFVFPTLSEGTPRVLVEARANSLPVVATNVGGIPTSVTHGVDGLLVPPKDPRALAAAVDTIIANSKLRQDLIRQGIGFAQRSTIEAFTEQAVALLRQSV